ncbi:MAG TPA: VOC family protein [Terriglobales bacterium]|nr:VOC family protein [Terriglobales bacterium]
MRLITHLNFDGQCEEAFKFYEGVLGGKILTMMPFEGSPMADQSPPEWRKKILHATLDLGDSVLMGADALPSRYQKPQGFSVTIGLSDPTEAERIFRSLAENGIVQLPLQETFWAARFGMLVDRFGIPWMVNCGKGA